MSGITKPSVGAQLKLDHPLSRGLVGCWLLNENSGNKAHDYSGQGNLGTLTNMDPATDWIGSLHGGALDFDGSNDYLDVNDNPTLNPTAITVSAWVKFNSLTNDYSAIVHKGPDPYYEYFVKSNGKLAVFITASEGYRNYDGTGIYVLTTGLWYHLVFTYDSVGGLKGYVNGNLDNSVAANGTLSTPTGNLSIARDSVTAGRYVNGIISSVSIYNRALSAQEIAWLYAFPYAMFEEESPYWIPFKAAGGAIDLVPAEGMQEQAADTPALTQVHNLVTAEGVQTQGSDAPALTQVHTLVSAEGVQEQASDSPALTQAHILTADEGAQVQVSDSPALTQIHVLVPAEDYQEQISDTPALTQTHVLAAQEGAQDQVSDEPVLVVGGINLEAAEGVQDQASDVPALTQIHVLAPAEGVQEQVSDETTITITGIFLVAAENVQDQASDSPVLTQAHSLIAAEGYQGQFSDAAVLGMIQATWPVIHSAIGRTRIQSANARDRIQATTARD